MRLRNDLELYARHASNWWSAEGGALRSLRCVGSFHLGLLEREWGAALDGARVVDLGCGGGLLALGLADLGARVVGVDVCSASLGAARDETLRRSSDVALVRGDLRSVPLSAGSCDFAVLSDVLEHLAAPSRALAEAARVLRPGGRLFVSTFDRSVAARLLVVHVAEGIGLVPRGTHDPRLFVRPTEIADWLRPSGLHLERLAWEAPDLLRTLRTWTVHLREARRGIGFSAFFAKETG